MGRLDMISLKVEESVFNRVIEAESARGLHVTRNDAESDADRTSFLVHDDEGNFAMLSYWHGPRGAKIVGNPDLVTRLVAELKSGSNPQ
jgi:hypothetical protein